MVLVRRPSPHLDRLWKAKRDAGYSSNSVRIMRTVLRRALGQAVHEGIVSRNVADLSVALRIRAKEGRTLTLMVRAPRTKTVPKVFCPVELARLELATPACKSPYQPPVDALTGLATYPQLTVTYR